MKPVALATLLLSLLCFAPALEVQAQTRRIGLRTHYTALRQAVCVQQWYRAVALADEIIASGQLSPTATDQMVAYRFYLEQYRRNNTRFDSVPGCTTPTRIRPAGRQTSPPPTPTEQQQTP